MNTEINNSDEEKRKKELKDLEILEEKTKKKEILLNRKKAIINSNGRRARNRRLIRQGLLIDFAELKNYDLATILGHLLELKKENKNKFYLNNCYMIGKTKFLEKHFKYDEEKGEKDE